MGKTISEQAIILGDVEEIILQLDSTRDILNLTGKRKWDDTMRNHPCAFADGIGKSLLPILRNFLGIIICEHECLDFALEDRKVLISK